MFGILLQTPLPSIVLCSTDRHVDYPRYAQANNISFNPLETHQITISDLESIIKFQNLPPFQVGDIFFLYTGFIDALETLSEKDSVSLSVIWTIHWLIL